MSKIYFKVKNGYVKKIAAYSLLQFIVSGIGLIVFIGLTAYDTQKLKVASGGAAVAGALALYLDFVNMFLFILQLFGSRRD